MAVPLAEAKTSAVPSLPICVARSVEEPKLNVTVVPGFAASKSLPICVNAPVSDEAANTLRVFDPVAEPEPELLLLEQATAARSKQTAMTVMFLRIDQTSLGVGRYRFQDVLRQLILDVPG
jgi:hypothetical protein